MTTNKNNQKEPGKGKAQKDEKKDRQTSVSDRSKEDDSRQKNRTRDHQ